MREITKTISIPVDGNNQNVEAPVTINVTAVGSDPETVGKSICDMAERYLLRTLQAL